METPRRKEPDDLGRPSERPGADVRREVSTREGYDLWAQVYDGEGNPLVEMEGPLFEAAVGDVRGLRVLDVGCGTGRHALRLASRGGVVTGVDFSEGMLGEARRKGEKAGLGVRWVQHDIAGRLPFEDGQFDRVVCGLVLDHVRDVEGLMREMGRVCGQGVLSGNVLSTERKRGGAGKIVVSIMHPAMMLLGVQARFTDPASGVKTYPASVANSISDYVMGALRAGLVIEKLSEHCCDEALAARVHRAGRYIGWPMLLMMEMRGKS